MRLPSFSLRQLLMFFALVGVVLTFAKVEPPGKPWQEVTSVDISRDGRYAALGGVSGRRVNEDFCNFDRDVTCRVLLVDLNRLDGKPSVLEEGLAAIGGPTFGWSGRFATFSLDSKVLVFGSVSNQMRCWGLEHAQVESLPIRDEICVRSAAFSPDRSSVVVAGGDDVLFYHFDGRVEVRSADDRGSFYEDARAVSFSPDGKLLVVAAGKHVDIIEAQSRKSLPPVMSLENGLWDWAAFSPDGSELALCSWDHVQILTTKDWSARKLTSPVGTVMRCIAFSPNGRALAVASKTGVGVVDVATGQPVGEPFCTDSADSVTISADGRFLLAGFDDGSARLWDFKTRKLLRTFAVVHYPTGISWIVPAGFLMLWLGTVIYLRNPRRKVART